MKILKRILLLIVIGAAAVASLVVWQGYQMYRDAVEQMSVEEKAEEIMGKENYTAFDQLPQTYVNAVIAAEDRRFRYHNGFDIISTTRAAWRNIQSKEIVEGGSTITQQLGRLMYFSRKRNIPERWLRYWWRGKLRSFTIRIRYWNFMLIPFTSVQGTIAFMMPAWDISGKNLRR